MNICNDDQLLTSKNYLIQKKKKKKTFRKTLFFLEKTWECPTVVVDIIKNTGGILSGPPVCTFSFFFFFSSHKVHVYFNVHVHCLFIIYRQFLFFCWWKSLLSFRVHTIRPNNLSLILYLKILAVNLYVLYVFNIYVNFHINQM